MLDIPTMISEITTDYARYPVPSWPASPTTHLHHASPLNSTSAFGRAHQRARRFQPTGSSLELIFWLLMRPCWPVTRATTESRFRPQGPRNLTQSPLTALDWFRGGQLVGSPAETLDQKRWPLERALRGCVTSAWFSASFPVE